jgi:hypothetical protein
MSLLKQYHHEEINFSYDEMEFDIMWIEEQVKAFAKKHGIVESNVKICIEKDYKSCYYESDQPGITLSLRGEL